MVRQYKMEREYDVLVGRNFTLEELKHQYPTKARYLIFQLQVTI